MRPSQLKREITNRFKAGVRRTLHIVGSPGLGKTQIVKQCALDMGVGFKAIHAPLMQPEDYGFPMIDREAKDVLFIVSHDKFPLRGSACPKAGILLIDELPQCDQAGQKILANLCQEREIHGQHLLDDWIIVTTGNNASDGAGASELLTHLGNRVTRVEFEVSMDDWIEWAIHAKVPNEIISFIRFRPNLLNQFDRQQRVNPTPRAWAEGVGADMGVVSPESEFEFFKGAVGEGAATEFCSFLKICRELPDIDDVLKNPTKAKVPSQPATLYALCGALGARTLPDNFADVMAYVKRMPPEFSVMFIRDTLKRVPEVSTTKAFVAWSMNEGKKILS